MRKLKNSVEFIWVEILTFWTNTFQVPQGHCLVIPGSACLWTTNKRKGKRKKIEQKHYYIKKRLLFQSGINLASSLTVGLAQITMWPHLSTEWRHVQFPLEASKKKWMLGVSGNPYIKKKYNEASFQSHMSVSSYFCQTSQF